MRPITKLTPLGLLLSTPVVADPGLGSLAGLWVVYLIGLVILLLGLILLFFLARAGFRLARSGDASDIATGRGILAVLALVAIATTTRFTDFRFYLLLDNTYPDAVTITRAHVERYMETDDGRAFYLSDMGLSYFKPGRSVVLRSNPHGVMRVNDIFEASRSMYHRLSDKKFWIPIIPVEKDRYGLQDRGPVTVLQSNWSIDDLEAGVGTARVSWCCDPGWVRLLLARGADPNRPINNALPLYTAVQPIGWQYKDEDIAMSEAALAELVAAGVDVNAVNEKGNTALHSIAFDPHERSVVWLLAHGANSSLVNHDGKTPIDVLRHREKQFGRYWDAKKRKQMHAIVSMMK